MAHTTDIIVNTILMISTRILAALVIAFGTLAAGGFFLIGNASAEGNTSRTSLIERIASRFNLSTSDVQSVFDEDRKEHQAEMEQRFEEKLSEAVSNGTITEKQKALILAKHEELQKEREADFEARKDMTPEERRADAEKHREEMKAWAEANNIPDEFVGPNMDGGMRGHGGGIGRNEK